MPGQFHSRFTNDEPGRRYHELTRLRPSNVFAYTAFEGATVSCVSEEATENNVIRPAMIQAEIGKRVLTRIWGDDRMAKFPPVAYAKNWGEVASFPSCLKIFLAGSTPLVRLASSLRFITCRGADRFTGAPARQLRPRALSHTEEWEARVKAGRYDSARSGS